MLPETLQAQEHLKAIDNLFPDAIVTTTETRGEVGLLLRAQDLTQVCAALRSDWGFDRLSSVTAVDWWPETPRFEVVYHLQAIRGAKRLRLKLRVAEGEEVSSVTHIWRTANWYEREAFDLFGIPFANHPNLERIMMPADWDGHPLRKDYPVHGYKYSYSEDV